MKIWGNLVIAAELKNLAEIRDFIEETASEMGMGPPVVADLKLAVDEAAANVIRHGYRGQAGQIEIEIGRRGTDLVVQVRDKAPPFDPTMVPPPDPTIPLLERPPGGLGIQLIRGTMDALHYRRTAGGENQLTLVKHLN